MCWLYVYLPPEWVWKCFYIFDNNVIHISSAIYNYVYRDRDTLLLWPCLRMYFKHETHGVLQTFYTFQKCDLLFHQTFCFLQCEFFIWVVSDENNAMLTRRMYNFGIYATLTTTHNLVSGKHLIQLGWKNVT